MLTIRKAADRGHAQFGWLDSRHTFSFGEYFDRRHMGFGPLRVINEDKVQAGRGFGTHSHRDMEIISYVLSGALEHRDSLGNGSVIRPGDVQRMSAGTGVQHSEFNPSAEEGVHFLQIWIIPRATGLPPGYAEKRFDVAAQPGAWTLLVSGDGREGSIAMNQDADLRGALLEEGMALDHAFRPGRLGWLQVARGSVQVEGHELDAGDGAAIRGAEGIRIEARARSEVLLFDMVP
jgi:redox-sensitive bicupin YhaK (pirin superfamily)